MFFSFSRIIIGGQNIYITKDAGKTWQTINLHLGLNGSLYAISFAPGGKVGWAIGQEGKRIQNGGWFQLKTQFVIKTADAGKTWTREKLPVKKLGFLTDVWAISDQQAWLSSFYGYAWTNAKAVPPRLFRTTNGGKTWKDKTERLISIRKLFFLNSSEGWAVGGQSGSGLEPSMAVLIYNGKK
ncbi:MAG: hypothetical protein M1501_03045 [Candidatus Omnitrophica bacterium]|nr:hypothetical protein [Candidatus Omnitrophota bacterium]